MPRLNAYASFMEMTINKAIGEAAPRLNYNQTTQANQLTNIKAIRDELLLVTDHAKDITLQVSETSSTAIVDSAMK